MTVNCIRCSVLHGLTPRKIPQRREWHMVSKTVTVLGSQNQFWAAKIRNRPTLSYERRTGALSMIALRLERNVKPMMMMMMMMTTMSD